MGWNPNGQTYNFILQNVPNVDPASSVFAATIDRTNWNVCSVNMIAAMTDLQPAEAAMGETKEGLTAKSNMTSP